MAIGAGHVPSVESVEMTVAAEVPSKAVSREGMRLEDKLFLNRFNADSVSHLKIISREVCLGCRFKPCTMFCSAGVYKWEEDRITIAYEGCLECGTCRIGCPYANIQWDYPRGGFGISYKYG